MSSSNDGSGDISRSPWLRRDKACLPSHSASRRPRKVFLSFLCVRRPVGIEDSGRSSLTVGRWRQPPSTGWAYGEGPPGLPGGGHSGPRASRLSLGTVVAESTISRSHLRGERWPDERGTS